MSVDEDESAANALLELVSAGGSGDRGLKRGGSVRGLSLTGDDFDTPESLRTVYASSVAAPHAMGSQRRTPPLLATLGGDALESLAPLPFVLPFGFGRDEYNRISPDENLLLRVEDVGMHELHMLLQYRGEVEEQDESPQSEYESTHRWRKQSDSTPLTAILDADFPYVYSPAQVEQAMRPPPVVVSEQLKGPKSEKQLKRSSTKKVKSKKVLRASSNPSVGPPVQPLPTVASKLTPQSKTPTPKAPKSYSNDGSKLTPEQSDIITRELHEVVVSFHDPMPDYDVLEEVAKKAGATVAQVRSRFFNLRYRGDKRGQSRAAPTTAKPTTPKPTTPKPKVKKPKQRVTPVPSTAPASSSSASASALATPITDSLPKSPPRRPNVYKGRPQGTATAATGGKQNAKAPSSQPAAKPLAKTTQRTLKAYLTRSPPVLRRGKHEGSDHEGILQLQAVAKQELIPSEEAMSSQSSSQSSSQESVNNPSGHQDNEMVKATKLKLNGGKWDKEVGHKRRHESEGQQSNATKATKNFKRYTVPERPVEHMPNSPELRNQIRNILEREMKDFDKPLADRELASLCDHIKKLAKLSHPPDPETVVKEYYDLKYQKKRGGEAKSMTAPPTRAPLAPQRSFLLSPTASAKGKTTFHPAKTPPGRIPLAMARQPQAVYTLTHRNQLSSPVITKKRTSTGLEPPKDKKPGLFDGMSEDDRRKVEDEMRHWEPCFEVESDSECSDESSSSESDKEDLIIASSEDESTESSSQD